MEVLKNIKSGLCFSSFMGHKKQKKVFLKMLQNSLKIVRNAVFNLRLKFCNCIKKRRQHMCFPKNFEDVLRTPILYNIDRRLLQTSSKNENSSTGKIFRSSHSQKFFKICVLKNFPLKVH